IRGFHSVTLMLENAVPTGAILTDVFGFKQTGREGSLLRYEADGGLGSSIIIREAGGFLPGRMGRGLVHHIAFRAANDIEQAQMSEKVREAHRIGTTSQIDRQYFRSVYFREPGGILFEIATDQPGFAVDEPLAALGRELKLPPFLESRRLEIEAVLPPLAHPERPPRWPRCRSFTASNPARTLARSPSYFCTGPEGTSTISSHWVRRSREARPCCRRAARLSSTGCGASFADLQKACSTKRMCVCVRTSS